MAARRHPLASGDPFRYPEVPLTLEQLELRRLVLKQVTAHPDTFDMRDWEENLSAGNGECRTTRCIAGWAQYFARGEVTFYSDGERDVEVDAITLLGLTRDEFRVSGAKNLFYASNQAALTRLHELAGGGNGSDWDDK